MSERNNLSCRVVISPVNTSSCNLGKNLNPLNEICHTKHHVQLKLHQYNHYLGCFARISRVTLLGFRAQFSTIQTQQQQPTSQLARGHFRDIENQTKFLDTLKHKLNINQWEDWYKLSKKVKNQQNYQSSKFIDNLVHY